MKHIGTYLDATQIDKMVQRLAANMEQQRQAGIQDFGWKPDCECHECGDTGFMGDPRKESLCWCDKGRDRRLTKELEESWPKYAPMIHVNSRIETHPVAKAQEYGRRWIAEWYPQNRGMVLSGNVGSGKTGLAVSLAHHAHMDGKRVRIGTFTEILDEMRPAGGNAAQETVPADLYKPALLVLDDLGTQKVTEFVSERLFAIVDGRHQRHLPTIITTNLDLMQLNERFGDRVVSRIVEVSQFVTLSGPDLRYRKVRAA